MLYRKMKKNDDELSVLGFGCMRLPQKRGNPGDGRIDEKPATEQIRMAIDEGVNYIDTAFPYHMGGSEPFLSRALSDGYREKVKVATKLPRWIVKQKSEMDTILNSQLNRLKTNQIDYYLIHALDGKSWKELEALGVAEFLDRAKTDGRIANAGFSFHGNRKSFTTIVDAYDWDFCQIQYNFLDQKNQAGTKGLKYAASKDMGIIVMEPLRGGLLARQPPPEIIKLWDESEEKRTPAEWSLRWIWDHPEVTVVLSGMNDKKHIRENIQIANNGNVNSLSDAELELISKVEKKYRSLMKAGCTGCHYCMPCPNGVDIPTCFEAFNHSHMYGDDKWAKLFYISRVAIGENTGRASQCEQCGECEEVCPQKLPIQDILKEVSVEMEGRFFDTKVWIFNKFFNFKRWQTLRGEKNN